MKDKTDELRSKKSKSKLDTYRASHPEPVVKGPQSRLYIIDQHHLARALADLEETDTSCVQVEDFSALTPEAFWQKMAAKNWVYPKDRGAPKSATELPDSVRGMIDDPYRSLAGYVEDEGGFDKSPAPFAEFKWADFFRTRISSDLVAQNMHKAIKKALKLAQSQDACGLPGVDEDICD